MNFCRFLLLCICIGIISPVSYGMNKSHFERLVEYGFQQSDEFKQKFRELQKRMLEQQLIDCDYDNLIVEAQYGLTALHLVSEYGMMHELEELLNNGADINAQEGFNLYAPLHLAVLAGEYDIVTYLLDQNDINLEIKDKLGRTALMLAVEAGNIEILNLLISYDADPATTSLTGNTPLHAAALHGYIDIIEILLANDCVDINAPRNSLWQNLSIDRTPLMNALIEEHDDCVTLLTKMGAADLTQTQNDYVEFAKEAKQRNRS